MGSDLKCRIRPISKFWERRGSSGPEYGPLSFGKLASALTFAVAFTAAAA
jgi:hypothetical protein